MTSEEQSDPDHPLIPEAGMRSSVTEMVNNQPASTVLVQQIIQP